MTRYEKFKVFMLIILLSTLLFTVFMLCEMRHRQVETTAKIEFINDYCLE